MPEENGINSELERALRSLRPQAVHVDTADAAFAAGKCAARRQLRLWQGASALFLLAAISAWFLPFERTAQPNSLPTAHFSDPSNYAPKANSEPLSQVSLARLQEAVNKQGLAGLPETSIPPMPPLRIDGL